MSETRREIVKLAEKLIRTKGYNAFSYRDISGPLQIKNAAIHYHFPSKKDVGVAVIDRNRAAFKILTSGPWKQVPIRQQLLNFIDVYDQSRQTNLICFMGALGPTYLSLPVEMQEHLTLASREIRGWLHGLLQRGLDEGVFHFDESAAQKADSIISALLASLILERIASEDVLLNVKTSILKNI